MICFHCGRYGHKTEICLFKSDKGKAIRIEGNHLPRKTTGDSKCNNEGCYGPWMIVEKRQSRGPRLTIAKSSGAMVIEGGSGYQFEILDGIMGVNFGDFWQEFNVEDHEGFTTADFMEGREYELPKDKSNEKGKATLKGRKKSD